MTTQLKTTSLPEAVYEALREQILSAKIEPGALVTESAIALEYGVARPTAKAALERLVSEGLLTRRAHRTARVPELGRDDIVDLFENRATVEAAAISALAAGGSIPPPPWTHTEPSSSEPAPTRHSHRRTSRSIANSSPGSRVPDWRGCTTS